MHAQFVILVQQFHIKQKQPTISIVRYIHIYIAPCKYNSSYYRYQTWGHQEETRDPPHKFRCLFPNLYLIYMTLVSMFFMFCGSSENPDCTRICLFIHTYIYIYTNTKLYSSYRYNLHEFPRHCCLIVSEYTYKDGQTSKTDPKKLFTIYIYMYMVWVCMCVQ